MHENRGKLAHEFAGHKRVHSPRASARRGNLVQGPLRLRDPGRAGGQPAHAAPAHQHAPQAKQHQTLLQKNLPEPEKMVQVDFKHAEPPGRVLRKPHRGPAGQFPLEMQGKVPGRQLFGLRPRRLPSLLPRHSLQKPPRYFLLNRLFRRVSGENSPPPAKRVRGAAVPRHGRRAQAESQQNTP